MYTVEQLEAALRRFNEYSSRILSKTQWCSQPTMTAQYEARREWIMARGLYINTLLKLAKEQALHTPGV